jgi:hypothetical protein
MIQHHLLGNRGVAICANRMVILFVWFVSKASFCFTLPHNLVDAQGAHRYQFGFSILTRPANPN